MLQKVEEGTKGLHGVTGVFFLQHVFLTHDIYPHPNLRTHTHLHYRGYNVLQGFTASYKGLQGDTGVYRGLQGVRMGYTGLQGVRGVYRGLQEVTEEYKGLESVTRGYRMLYGA